MGGGGGGGDRSPLPASKGRLPKLAARQFTPPMAVVNNPNPKLIMEPTLVIPPDVNLPNVNMAQYGDPLGKIGPPSNGPGSGGGIGSRLRRRRRLRQGRRALVPVKAADSAAACSGLAAASPPPSLLSRWSPSTPKKRAKPSFRAPWCSTSK